MRVRNKPNANDGGSLILETFASDVGLISFVEEGEFVLAAEE